MTCRELADFISDYLAGELPDMIRVPFEHHLSVCPNCVNYIASLRSTIALSHGAFEARQVDPPLPMPEDLVRAILAVRHSTGSDEPRSTADDRQPRAADPCGEE